MPLALVLGMGASLAGQEPGPNPAAGPQPRANSGWLSDEARRLHLASFDMIWETIRDKHFDPALNGVDWQSVRDELRPKLEQAEDEQTAREIMSDMIDRLGQSHFGILPRAAYDSIREEERVTGDGVPGLHVRVVGNDALVVKVESNFPAEKAGVKPGWIIRSIRDQQIAPILERVSKAYENSTQKPLRLAMAVEGRLRGPVGQTLPIEFVDGENQTRKLEIGLARPPGNPARFGNLPPMRVEFESKRLDGDIAYIAFNLFFDPSGLMPKIGEAVEQAIEAPGLILDLRGNPGGIGAMAMGIGGWFIPDKGRKLGTMITRDSRLNFVILPRPQVYSGPLAILVDGCSASTTEILAGGLQDLGRGRVFGTPTAGAALPSTIVRLPNGDGFQYAFANYIAEGGQALEGRGVLPDELVAPTREALLKQRDPVLQAALDWIRSQPRATGSR